VEGPLLTEARGRMENCINFALLKKLKRTVTGRSAAAIEDGVDVVLRAEYICDISTPPGSAR
jgi:hypothetical protein